MPTGKYPHVINVFLVLVSIGIEVKSGRVSYVTSGFVRYNRNIVAYLVLIRITLRRIK